VDVWDTGGRPRIAGTEAREKKKKIYMYTTRTMHVKPNLGRIFLFTDKTEPNLGRPVTYNNRLMPIYVLPVARKHTSSFFFLIVIRLKHYTSRCPQAIRYESKNKLPPMLVCTYEDFHVVNVVEKFFEMRPYRVRIFRVP